jgi:hypothetical protein
MIRILSLGLNPSTLSDGVQTSRRYSSFVFSRGTSEEVANDNIQCQNPLLFSGIGIEYLISIFHLEVSRDEIFNDVDKIVNRTKPRKLKKMRFIAARVTYLRIRILVCYQSGPWS